MKDIASKESKRNNPVEVGRGVLDVPGMLQALIDINRNNPEVIAASRKGKITLEDVFIGLTGKAIRS